MGRLMNSMSKKLWRDYRAKAVLFLAPFAILTKQASYLPTYFSKNHYRRSVVMLQLFFAHLIQISFSSMYYVTTKRYYYEYKI